MMEFTNLKINEVIEKKEYHDTKRKKWCKYKTPKRTIKPVFSERYANLEEVIRELTVASDRLNGYGGHVYLEVKFKVNKDQY
tara:strand:+ start:938 stop:1183 length:246 start_codon:yes stop_codon:yes gene_type:complete